MKQIHMQYSSTNDVEHENFTYSCMNADSLQSALSAMAYFLRRMGHDVVELRVDNPDECDIITTSTGDDRQ